MSRQLSALELVLLPDDRAEDIRQSILLFFSYLTDRNDAIWAAWLLPTFTPLQPLLFLVTLCTFPAVVSSVPGPVTPARPATMKFKSVARL